MVKNPSISLQLQQPGAVQKTLLGRYRPTGWVNPSPTGRLLISWGSWSQRGARVAPRANAAVPPQPGRIHSHPQVRNPSMSLQAQLTGDVNANPPGRYVPARCENPSSTGRLLIGSGSSSHRAARVTPRIYAAVPPQPGKISCQLRVRNSSVSVQFHQLGAVQQNLPGRYHPTRWANPSPTGRLLIGCGFWRQRGARVAPWANAAVPP